MINKKQLERELKGLNKELDEIDKKIYETKRAKDLFKKRRKIIEDIETIENLLKQLKQPDNQGIYTIAILSVIILFFIVVYFTGSTSSVWREVKIAFGDEQSYCEKNPDKCKFEFKQNECVKLYDQACKELIDSGNYKGIYDCFDKGYFTFQEYNNGKEIGCIEYDKKSKTTLFKKGLDEIWSKKSQCQLHIEGQENNINNFDESCVCEEGEASVYACDLDYEGNCVLNCESNQFEGSEEEFDKWILNIDKKQCGGGQGFQCTKARLLTEKEKECKSNGGIFFHNQCYEVWRISVKDLEINPINPIITIDNERIFTELEVAWDDEKITCELYNANYPNEYYLNNRFCDLKIMAQGNNIIPLCKFTSGCFGNE